MPSPASLRGARAALILSCLSLLACTPTLDWREVRPEGANVVALFPCKPSQEVRTITLNGSATRMVMNVCRAGGVTYALAFADVADPSGVTPALLQLRSALAGNVGAKASVVEPMKVVGMTPNPQAGRISASGQFPDGGVVAQEAGFFVKGTVVFQAAVMGPQLDAEAVGAFFDGLKLPP